MKTLNDFNLEGKRVLVRCDFNVPLKNGKILDDFRIRQTIPTIRHLREKKAKVILISHLGRPQEVKTTELKIKKFSLKPIAKRLEKLLKARVKFLPDCIGQKIEGELSKIKSRGVVLLENLRFYDEEEKNDEKFAKALSRLGDIFINDAFACSHRAHASIVGIVKYLPSGIGLLLESEIKNLGKIIKEPSLPLIAIFGGDDPDVKEIDKISEKANWILIGGLIQKAIMEKGIKFRYPQKIIKPVDNSDKKDIGKGTINLFKEKILQAKTIFWSGPLGKIEEKKFQKGTKEIVRAIIASKAFSVIGGGETIDFINDLGWSQKFNHLSTGGSAMLEFLSGTKLPGLKVLGYYGNKKSKGSG